MTKSVAPGSVMILIPALNEAQAIAQVIAEIRSTVPGTPILVVDDCSLDSTATAARTAGADVLSLPHHLGLGGCLQAGYRLAFELGYEYVVRMDGDGQMDPKFVPLILDKLRESGCQMVIGSRYMNGGIHYSSLLRQYGIRFFRLMLRPILGKPVKDPTSGFVGVNREALEVFSRSFPLEYPEIETLVVLKRRAFRFEEVPCRMRTRRAGVSTITPLKSIYYIVHVLLGVLVNILKFERSKWRM
ncbi:MAG: glycosyltransferase family 2 protein [Acidobacteriia bacterium]|nr:glycosyltransferase family 2 protein [Terriglobia bacterium]